MAVLGSGGAGAEYEAKYQENLTEITRLNSELTALTNENERRPDASEITVAMKSANTAGMAVAGLQTAYQDCVVNAGETGSDGFESAITKNAEALDVYFDDTAKNARSVVHGHRGYAGEARVDVHDELYVLRGDGGVPLAVQG